MNYRPLNDYVVVKLEEKMTKTKGGVFITDNADTPNNIGRVVSVGENINMTKRLVINDKVLISYDGAHKTHDADVFIIPYKSILAVIE